MNKFLHTRYLNQTNKTITLHHIFKMSTIRPDIIAMFEHALQHGFAQSRVDLRGKYVWFAFVHF